MRVFGIGLSRTGTTSLVQAMKILGFSVCHLPADIRAIHLHQFSNDISVTIGMEFLAYMYPEALFIHTHRDMRSWAASCERWFKAHPNPDEHTKLLRRLTYGVDQWDKDAFEAAYIRHMIRTNDLARSIGGRAHVLDICAGQGWAKLCEFLRVKIPPVPFPHLNQGETSTQRAASCPVC